MDDALYVLDVSWYAHRAYAIDPLRSPSLFSGMVRSLRADHLPRQLVAAVDSHVGSWRRDLYPKYKTGRVALADDFGRAHLMMLELLTDDGVTCFQFDSYEADDVIASVVKQSRLPVVIVSSDKDLMQLVTDHVMLLDTMRDHWIGPAQVKDRWGVSPAQIRDLLALMGDHGDSIPGVPGVGPKTAADLLARFGCIDDLYEHIEQVSGALQEKLAAHEQNVRLWQRLVSLDATLPIW